MKPVLLLLSLLCCLHLSAQTIDPALQATLDSIRVAHGIPGMAAVVVKADTSLFAIGGVARADRPEGPALTLDRSFHLGSNTKAITSFMAMKLVESGKIELTTRYVDLFPDRKDSIRDVYQPATLGDFLSHRARVPAFTGGVEFNRLPPITGSREEQREAFVQFILTEAPVASGTYSNAGYVVAARMIEQAAGKTYESLLEQTMDELGVSYLIGRPNVTDTLNPWGHFQAGEVLNALGPDHPYNLPPFMISAGDVSMSPLDYAQFIQLHVKGLLGQDNYLTSAHYQQLHFAFDDYSYGWGNGKRGEVVFSGHDGSIGTYYASTHIVPEQKLACIVCINAAAVDHVKGLQVLRDWMIVHYGE